jgi:hypothetical protein
LGLAAAALGAGGAAMVTPEFITNMVQDGSIRDRNECAKHYAKLLTGGYYQSVKGLNQAIIDRWSVAGLNYIKTRAWKLAGWS